MELQKPLDIEPDNTPDEIRFKNLITMLRVTPEPEMRKRLSDQISELRLKMNGAEGRSIEYRSADKAADKTAAEKQKLDDLIWRKQAEIALDDALFEIKNDGVK